MCAQFTILRSQRTAFTLVELIAVLAVLGILAISALPVVSSIDEARENGLLRELERSINTVRSHAVTTGSASGLQLDLANQTLALLVIPQDGGAPMSMTGPTGTARTSAQLNIHARFPGASITSMTINGESDQDTIWFDFDGAPHLRTAQGVLIGPLPGDVLITVAGSRTLTLRRSTGLVER